MALARHPRCVSSNHDVIEFRDVSYVNFAGTEHEVAALQGITLRIEPGEFVAIAGRNGSGKTTLARHMNALLLPTSGTVTVDGLDTREPATHWDVRQRVGMVFQNP